MAWASSLEDELSCPVCCELFHEPQMLSCGHSFCRCCLEKHCAINPARGCPICRQASPHKPVSNLALRNTCESYLREREKAGEGDVRCSLHGEKMSFFCRTDEKMICLECRRYTHNFHRVQPLSQAVQRHKIRLKAALRPAEKALEALKNGSTPNTRISKYIESQAQRAERLIRKEFEKFHQFLCDEEKARISALKKEGDQKKKKVQENTEREIQSLVGKVKEVEDELKNDGASFLQNFDYMLKRAEYTPPDSEFGSEDLINMPEHVGNLGYRVWEKMIDIIHYYPVVLDPNTAPADFSISDDLASVAKTSHDGSIPTPHRGNRLVLGSKGYTGNEAACWDIEVGDSKHWTIGLCHRSAEMNHSVQSMNPQNGFWGLSRHGDYYRLLVPNANSFRKKRKLGTVRVQLGWQVIPHSLNTWQGKRILSFLDAGDNSMIAFTPVPTEVALFPFLIPDERFSRLRISSANVVHSVEHRIPIENKDIREIVFLLFVVVVSWILGMLLKKE